MNEPIRILHVCGVMNRGGAENMIMNLYRTIDRTKIQFDFVVHQNEKGVHDDEIISLGGNIYHCPSFSPSNYLRYKKWWNCFFKSHREYKILHSHIRSSAVVYLKLSKKHGIISIIHSHSTSNGKGLKSIAKRILQAGLKKYADYFFACSYKAGEWLFGKKITESKHFFIFKNAIDLKQYQFDNEKRKMIRDEFSIDKSALVFVHVGRFHQSKNHTFLINLFKLIASTYNNSRLLLVGDGELRESIKKQVDELNLNNQVVFTGIREDVPSILMAADCFLFPSNWEGLPLTVIEAQAVGLPCYVSQNVTKEVKLLDSLTFLPINQGESLWLNEILKHGFKRTNSYNEIKTSGYDVNTTAEWIMKFYRSIIANEEKNC